MILKTWFDEYITANNLNSWFSAVTGKTIDVTYNITGLATCLKNKIEDYCHRLMHRNILDWNGDVLDELDEETLYNLNGCVKHQLEQLANSKENLIAATDINNGKNIAETKVNPIDNDFSGGTAGMLTTAGSSSYNILEIQARANELINSSSMDFAYLFNELAQFVSKEE